MLETPLVDLEATALRALAIRMGRLHTAFYLQHGTAQEGLIETAVFARFTVSTVPEFWFERMLTPGAEPGRRYCDAQLATGG